MYLVFVVWQQVVIPQLEQKRERVLYARHFGFVTAEKPSQIFIFQGTSRHWERLVRANIVEKNKPNKKRVIEILRAPVYFQRRTQLGGAFSPPSIFY